MSQREVDRLGVIDEVVAKRLRQAPAAAQMLGLWKRNVKRYWALGAVSLVSAHRGRYSNSALAPVVKAAAPELIRTECVDFDLTFARERLAEVHGFGVAVLLPEAVLQNSAVILDRW